MKPSELNPLIPKDTDLRLEFPSLLKETKKTLLDYFPNITSPVYTTPEALDGSVFGAGWQVGSITGFTGRRLPDKWALCDGSSYETISGVFQTPNLANLFIKGGESVNNSTKTSGVSSTKVSSLYTVRPHALTVDQIPPHKHEIGKSRPNFGGPSKNQVPYGSGTGLVTLNSGGGKHHTHILSDASDMIVDIPYYTMAYIIYVGELVPKKNWVDLKVFVGSVFDEYLQKNVYGFSDFSYLPYLMGEITPKKFELDGIGYKPSVIIGSTVDLVDDITYSKQPLDSDMLTITYSGGLEFNMPFDGYKQVYENISNRTFEEYLKNSVNQWVDLRFTFT